MAAEWEYTVVALPPVPTKEREQKHTELINLVAEHGWKLVAVTNDPLVHTNYTYFERRAQAAS